MAVKSPGFPTDEFSVATSSPFVATSPVVFALIVQGSRLLSYPEMTGNSLCDTDGIREVLYFLRAIPAFYFSAR
jgi:hypothetical protein